MSLKKKKCPYCKDWHFGPLPICQSCIQKKQEGMDRDADAAPFEREEGEDG